MIFVNTLLTFPRAVVSNVVPFYMQNDLTGL